MKTYILSFIVLVTSLIGFSSCQEESVEIIIPNDQDTLVQNSTVAILISQVAQNDGSRDNIVDSSSCIHFKFPYTLSINDSSFTVNSYEDLDDLEDLLEDLVDADFEILFPVVIVLPDFTEITINNEDELDDFVEGCIEGGFDDDIECVDFIYPLTFYTFNPSTEQAATVIIESDRDLYQFLDEWSDEIIRLNFPLRLSLAGGDTIMVNSNNELELVIEEYDDSCDEDDDNDFDDDDLDNELKTILKTDSWQVTSYDSAGTDRSDEINDFTFTFKENEVITAESGDYSEDGEWDTDVEDEYLELSFVFEAEILEELLEGDWKVITYSENQIELVYDKDDVGVISVIFTKN